MEAYLNDARLATHLRGGRRVVCWERVKDETITWRNLVLLLVKMPLSSSKCKTGFFLVDCHKQMAS